MIHVWHKGNAHPRYELGSIKFNFDETLRVYLLQVHGQCRVYTYMYVYGLKCYPVRMTGILPVTKELFDTSEKKHMCTHVVHLCFF